jgi:hypothetical protein
MKAKTVHCEECVEDIPNDEIYWEEDRMYCGRCGSELELTQEASDLFETITSGTASPLYTYEDDEYEGDEEEIEAEGFSRDEES